MFKPGKAIVPSNGNGTAPAFISPIELSFDQGANHNRQATLGVIITNHDATNFIEISFNNGKDWFSVGPATTTLPLPIVTHRMQLRGEEGVAATGTLTLTGNVTDADEVEIDGKTYTFQTVLTNVNGHVLIGLTASDSIDNLIAAITLGAGAGTLYAAATTIHPHVTAAAGALDTMVATANAGGTWANTISTTDPVDFGGVMSWGAVTLTGGTDITPMYSVMGIV